MRLLWIVATIAFETVILNFLFRETYNLVSYFGGGPSYGSAQ
jgi:hypothetical protein